MTSPTVALARIMPGGQAGERLVRASPLGRVMAARDRNWPNSVFGTRGSVAAATLPRLPNVTVLGARGWGGLLGLFTAVLLLGQLERLQGADRIVLRKLEVISDRTVVSFDEEGVRLDDGRTLGWDEIEQGTVSLRPQEFDRMLREVGDPLYRLRQRLSVGDYGGAKEPAETLWPRFRMRQGRSAYWASVALMWARLAEGRREEAVVPYLVAWSQQQRLQAPRSPYTLPGPRQLIIEEGTGFCPDLMPVAWQPQAAKDALTDVGVAVGQLPPPWPIAARVYYATLAVAAGEYARAATALNDPAPELAPWREVIAVEVACHTGQEVPDAARVAERWPGWNGALRVAALFALGRYLLQQNDPAHTSQGLLHLLRIAAEHPSGVDAEPVAVALHRAMTALEAQNDPLASLALRREIQEKFAHTRTAKALAESLQGQQPTR